MVKFKIWSPGVLSCTDDWSLPTRVRPTLSVHCTRATYRSAGWVQLQQASPVMQTWRGQIVVRAANVTVSLGKVASPGMCPVSSPGPIRFKPQCQRCDKSTVLPGRTHDSGVRRQLKGPKHVPHVWSGPASAQTTHLSCSNITETRPVPPCSWAKKPNEIAPS